MRIAVVGAGPSGLGCAVELAPDHQVTVIDRLPVAGGETGWQNAHIRKYVSKAHGSGVSFELGAMATRWDGTQLIAVSPLGSQNIDVDYLFFAGGIRPSTSAEIELSGDRPAGVIPATVALHLLESGVALWHDAVVIGEGHWASEIIAAITKQGGKCTSVITGEAGSDSGVTTIENAKNFKVFGTSRVERFECDVAEETLKFTCDAVILAGPARPNRNIEGALIDPASHCTFVQSTTLVDPQARFDFGRNEARMWAKAQGEIR